MNKVILISIFLFYFNLNAQNSNYDKKDKKELIQELENRDTKIKELENKIKKNNKNSIDSNLENEKSILIDIISETNEAFLYDAFENKYVKNSNYFKETDLSEYSELKFKNSNILLNSILNGKNTSNSDKKLCEKALLFNNNFIKLEIISKEVDSIINSRIDTLKVNQTIFKLDATSFETNSKIQLQKEEFNGLLKNYAKYTCELRKDLNKILINPKQDNQLVKNEYEKLKKSPIYKNYPYLIKVIDKVKNTLDTYVENEDLPCQLFEKKVVKKQTADNIEEPSPTLKTEEN